MASDLDLGNLLVHLKADTAQYKRAMISAKRQLTQFAKAASSIGSGIIRHTANAMRAIVDNVVKYTKRLAIVAAGILVASVKAFASFEDQMAKIATMLDKHTMYLLPQYAKAIKDMAVEFGEGTETITEGMYKILSAMIEPTKALDVLTASIKAAKAGATDTAVAAEAITRILNAYNLSADRAADVSDLLFAIVKRGQTDFGLLAPSIGKVAGVAASAGLSMEQLGAAMATVTRVLPTDVAMTSIRAILMGFLKPMDDAIKLAKKFDFELNSLTLQTIGLTGVLEKLKTKGVTGEELAILFPNVRALAGVAVALSRIETNLEDYEVMLNRAGLTQAAFEERTNTLIHTLRRWWQSMKITAINIGNLFEPAIRWLTDIIIEENKRLAEFFESEEVKIAITEWALTIAADINFVRKIMRDFLVGMYTDWPETWQFIKDVAIGQLDIIWQSFVFGIEHGIKAAIPLFIAFGKSLYDIFAKIFTDIGSSIGAWIANAETFREIQKSTAKVLLEERGYKFVPGTFIFADFPRTKEWRKGLSEVERHNKAKREWEEAMKEAHSVVQRAWEEGGYDDVIKKPEMIESWDAIIEKVKRHFTPALETAREELGKIRDEMLRLQTIFAEDLIIPRDTKVSYYKRLEELRERKREIKDIIAKMEEERDAAVGVASKKKKEEQERRRRKDDAAGADGGRLGFVSFEQAWGALATSLTARDKILNDILEVNKDQLGEQEETNDKLDDVGKVK